MFKIKQVSVADFSFRVEDWRHCAALIPVCLALEYFSGASQSVAGTVYEL